MRELASLTLDECGLCDLELLATGAYSPLEGFLNRADYTRVVRESRLASGTPWPLPIVLPVTPGGGVSEGKPLALRDVYGNLLAVLHIDEIYPAEPTAADGHRPSSSSNLTQIHYAAGRLEVLRLPPHYDFASLRRTPAELRELFQERGWSRVAMYPTCDPLHRAQEEQARRLADQIGGGTLVQALVGAIRPGDVGHFTRVRCLRALFEFESGHDRAALNLLPFADRAAGASESLLLAIVARNEGCSHLVNRRSTGTGVPGLEPSLLAEVGVGLLSPEPQLYLPDERRYVAASEVPAGARTASLSDVQVRDDYLARGVPLPEWFTRPAIAGILSEMSPPRFRQGLTIWFTGLSGSGKSTVAHALVERLAEFGRNCSALDGDEIRTHLSQGLGFSREDRDTNIRRVGYVAGLVNQHGGTILCSVISPYRSTRDEARAASKGNFVEVYCSTPLAACEKRDVKGLYARAKAALADGKPLGFTGVDDPYEPPLHPEVTVDTSKLSVAQCVDAIVDRLLELGYIVTQDPVVENTSKAASPPGMAK